MATVDTDKTSLKELIGTRGFEELNIQPLDRDAKSQMAIVSKKKDQKKKTQFLPLPIIINILNEKTRLKAVF